MISARFAHDGGHSSQAVAGFDLRRSTRASGPRLNPKLNPPLKGPCVGGHL